MTTLLHPELLKLRTTRGPWLLLIAAQATVLAGVAGFLATNDLDDPATAPSAMAHVGVASLFPLVLGILMVAGEYRYRTITETYLATPRRAPVIAVKLGLSTVIGLGFGLLGCLTALATAGIWYQVEGGAVDWSAAELWRTLGGGIGWNAAFAAIGVGLGSLIRTLSTAIATALAWLALVEGIVGQLIGVDLNRWLPFSAGAALGRVPDSIPTGLPQWGAALLLLGYAAALAAAALTWSIRRDVT